MSKNDIIPSKSELMDEIIKALTSLGGSAKTSDIDSLVAKSLKLSEEQLSYEDDTSTGTVYSYRMRWARTMLKQKGLLASPKRGMWTLIHRETL